MSAGLLGSAAAPALASTYSVTDLGSLGYGTTVATAINAHGQITGESYLGTEVQVKCPTPKHKGPCFTHSGHAFLWSNGTMTDLGTLGGLDSTGNAINDLGEVVGTSYTSNNGSSAFADQNGVMTAIAPGDATAVNDSGEIAGEGPFPVAGTPGDVFEQAFTYQSGKTTVLGLLPGEGGIFTDASGINSSGEVVGSGDNAAGDERAWKYQNGTMTDIGTLGGPQAAATAINTNGQIVGFAQTSSDADHGFLYAGGGITDLGLNIFPYAINDLGVIVGRRPGTGRRDRRHRGALPEPAEPGPCGIWLHPGHGRRYQRQRTDRRQWLQHHDWPRARFPADPKLSGLLVSVIAALAWPRRARRTARRAPRSALAPGRRRRRRTPIRLLWGLITSRRRPGRR